MGNNRRVRRWYFEFAGVVMYTEAGFANGMQTYIVTRQYR